jgi:hypothetical protein
MNDATFFNLYQRFWNHAQDAIFVVDSNTGFFTGPKPSGRKFIGLHQN